MIGGGPIRLGILAGFSFHGAAEQYRIKPLARRGKSKAKRIAGVPPAETPRMKTCSIPKRSSYSAYASACSLGVPSPLTELPGYPKREGARMRYLDDRLPTFSNAWS